jgi:D-glycero-D-manno-heptose 1,7-bisphosphate phosphatase
VTAAAPFDQRFALLDRDETIIIDKIYLSDPKNIEVAPFAIEGLRLLRDAGARLILLTNQSGIARGYFSEETLAAIHLRLREVLAASAGGVKGVRVASDFLMATRQAIDYFRGRQTKRRPCM